MMQLILQSPKCLSSFYYHLLISFASCTIILTSVADKEVAAPIVRTSRGQLRGQTVQQPTGAVDLFYGIPYAQPPVGELRFEKTRPAKGWKGILNATTVPAQCLQWVRPPNWDTSATVRAQFSEDCLYMNLFRPHISESDRHSNPLLPVLAIFHGGGFQQGSARRYPNTTEIGHKYLSQGILVVVLQFRIGVLGQASDGSNQFRGNFAYWDMAEALRWLRAELPAFGGDPQRITAWGYSSGSSSVGTLSISPQTRNLFAQQVLMSGLVMSVRSASDQGPISIHIKSLMRRQVAVETRKLAQAVGCSSANGTVKQCLKTKTLDQLFAGVDQIGSTRVGLNYVKFGPRMDGDFLPDDFPTLMQNSKPKPTIIGINEMEPLQSVLFGANDSLHLDAVPWAQLPTYGPDNFEEYVRRVMVHPAAFGNQTDNLVRDMMDFYLGSANATKGPHFYLEKLAQVMADLQFIVPMAYDLQLRAPRSTSRAPLFAYVNKYVNARFFPAQVHLHRAFHDNDHSYVFRNPDSNYQLDAQDEQMEGYHTQQLVNFVKNGNPSTDSIAWTPVAASKPLANQMLIQFPNPGMGQMPLDGIQFWDRMTVKYPHFNLIMGRRYANPLE